MLNMTMTNAQNVDTDIPTHVCVGSVHLVSPLTRFLILLLVCSESVGLRSKLLRKVEEMKSDSVCSGIPDEFLCPITRELMREPVIAAGRLKVETIFI